MSVTPNLQSTQLGVFQKLKRYDANNLDSTGNGCKTAVRCVMLS
ncbi:hypothetical protein [Microcoleus sp. D2_18a_D3]